MIQGLLLRHITECFPFNFKVIYLRFYFLEEEPEAGVSVQAGCRRSAPWKRLREREAGEGRVVNMWVQMESSLRLIPWKAWKYKLHQGNCQLWGKSAGLLYPTLVNCHLSATGVTVEDGLHRTAPIESAIFLQQNKNWMSLIGCQYFMHRWMIRKVETH